MDPREKIHWNVENWRIALAAKRLRKTQTIDERTKGYYSIAFYRKSTSVENSLECDKHWRTSSQRTFVHVSAHIATHCKLTLISNGKTCSLQRLLTKRVDLFRQQVNENWTHAVWNHPRSFFSCPCTLHTHSFYPSNTNMYLYEWLIECASTQSTYTFCGWLNSASGFSFFFSTRRLDAT